MSAGMLVVSVMRDIEHRRDEQRMRRDRANDLKRVKKWIKDKLLLDLRKYPSEYREYLEVMHQAIHALLREAK